MQPANGPDPDTGKTPPPPPPQPAGATPSEQPPKKRRKRRWVLRIFLVLLFLLIVLVAAAPYIASTRVVGNAILGVVNGQLQGRIAVDRMSLAWFDSCRIQNLEVTDPAGREVLRVSDLSTASGIWNVLFGGNALEEITINSPTILLHVNEDGSVSLAEAFASRNPEPEDEEKDEDFSLPDGAIKIHDGTVKVVQADGREYELSDMEVDVDLDSPGRVKAVLAAVAANGGSIRADIDASDLVTQGRLRPLEAKGTVRITTEDGVDLRPVGDFAAPGSGMVGRLKLDLDADIQPGRIAANLKSGVTGLAAPGATGGDVQPLDIQLSGAVNATRESLTGDINLGGEAAEFQSRFSYNLAQNLEGFDAERVVTSMIEGRSISLPEFETDVEGGIDLPALARAVPALLKIRPGTEVTSGKFRIRNLVVQGGDSPSARADIELSEVAVITDGQRSEWEPITTTVEVVSESGTGVRVEKMEIQSGFAQLQASGTLSSLEASLNSDLRKLQNQLAQVFEMGAFELAGQLTANLALARPGEDRIDVNANLTTEGLRYGTKEGTLDLGRTTVAHEGHLAMAADRQPKVVAKKTSVDVAGTLVASGSGWYDLEDGTFQADVLVDRAELSDLGRRAEAIGLEGLTAYSGSVQAQANLKKSAPKGEIVSDGTLRMTNVTVDGKTVTEQLDGAWTAFSLSPDESIVALQSARIESPIANLRAGNVTCRYGNELLVSGDVEANADVGRCMPAIARFAELEEPPNVSGQLALNTTCRSEGKRFTVTGGGTVDKFSFVSADGQSIQDRLEFQYDAALDNGAQKLAVEKFDLTSGLLSANVKGNVERLDTTRTLDLSGKYETSWKELTDLIHQFAPSTATTVALDGKHQGSFQAKGPLNRPELTPEYKELNAAADLGWSSADVCGVQLGKAVLEPALRGGQVNLPEVQIPSTTGGNVRLGGAVDLTGAEPTLRIPRQLLLLDAIKVTPELGRELLSRINPVFGHMSQVDGQVMLEVANIDLPLGESIEQRGAGSGVLDLRKLRVQPGGFFGELLELGGMGSREMYAVKTGKVDFVIENGRIKYDNFTLDFAEGQFDLIFRGSVGFDDTLDLVVSIPIRAELLTRLGVKGPVAEYAQKLSGTRVEIPVVGTREQPALDLTKVDTAKLLKDVVQEGLLKDVLGKDLLKNLPGGKRDKKR